jgi:hypothetical protein
MHELLPEGPWARLRPLAPLLVGALALCILTTPSLAQTAPATLRACASESDPSRRLACYDREMGRVPPSPPQTASPTPPRPPQASHPAPEQAPPAPNPPPATAPAAGKETPAPPEKSPWKIFSGGGSWQVIAHVTRLDRSPNSMVLHLDNGQVWRQVGRASGDLSLRTGDSVKIEKHLGSYWLSSRYVSNMKVRQERR